MAQDRQAVTAVLRYTAVLLVLTFGVIVYGHAFSNGLCCADDSTNAIVAKSLAFGHGYANAFPLDGSTGLRHFDGEITTGPAVNVPAAAVISLVGNTPWAPGVAAATINLALLLLTFQVLRGTGRPAQHAGYACLLILLLYGETVGRHFEHWYALLGEAPAALLCVLGTAVAVRGAGSRRSVCVAALVFGLAVTAKAVALLSIVPLGAWLAARAVRDRAAIRARAIDGLLAAIAYAAPTAAYHLWQIGVLGLPRYLTQTVEFWRFVRAHDAAAALPADLPSLGTHLLRTYASNASILQQQFGYSPVMLLAVALLAAMAVCRHAERPARVLFLALLAGALTHLTWWAFLSNGRLRYALIGLILYMAAVACAAFARRSWLTALALAPLVLMAGVRLAQPGAIQPARFVARTQYGPSPRVANLIKTAAFLSTLRAEEPFATGWWATAVDIEYAMPGVGHFVRIDRIDTGAARAPSILVRNTVWIPWEDIPGFDAWEQRCSEVLLDAPPYLVSRCPSLRPEGEARSLPGTQATRPAATRGR